MFERTEARVRARAEARARARVREIGAREVPGGVRAEPSEDAVVLTGRGLRRRLATDADLRWWRL